MDHLGRPGGPPAHTRPCIALRGAAAHKRRPARRSRSSGRPPSPREAQVGQLLPGSSVWSTCLRESRKAWVASADIWRWRRLTWAKAAVQAILSPTHTAGRAEYDMPSDPCPAQTACFEGVSRGARRSRRPTSARPSRSAGCPSTPTTHPRRSAGLAREDRLARRQRAQEGHACSGAAGPLSPTSGEGGGGENQGPNPREAPRGTTRYYIYMSGWYLDLDLDFISRL